MKNSGKNPFIRTTALVMTFIALAGLVLVFSIPIVTAGPALTAGYYVALKAVEGSEYKIWQGFRHSFAQNLRPGIALGLLVFIPGGLILFALEKTRAAGASGRGAVFTVLYVVLLLVFATYASAAVYVFPLLSRFDNTTGETMRIAVFTAFHFPQSTIIMTAGLLFILLMTERTVWWMGLVFLPLWLYLTAYMDAPVLAALLEEKNQHQEEDR
ncbi:MAG: DUF624 domain-containing protein [Lachnospiraceae bacterium]|jgi:uncharacterized membrane protein YesL|nr:DUF624 domain-containing protein [Lachnospiraceae bacterium]MCH4071205.1 DUF624 domain-containing protein [Lachnospiraceae bacterium]MCH4108049.1 DUF624 domain-containing protein [Lachnospiraceae bacterium]MCI1302762.1 DUF624 domain-containing protein [Lachnospiraceae bacterium]MCI1332012.1 DUF624 domain-containing protein [Lachnospiraceae bacterium]